MNIIDIYKQYGVDYLLEGHEHCRKGWVQTDCPYCSKDWKHYRLGFNLTGKYFVCWACGPHRLADTLMELTGVSFVEVKEILDTYEPLLSQQTTRPTIRRGKVVVPEGVGKLRQAHRDYLMKRGLNPKTIQTLWGVRGISFAKYLQWRLFIPIVYDGEMISWTTRSISKSAEKRYIAASEDDEKLPGKSVLYGEDFCRETVIVCEGPVDVWKVGRGAVATMGTSYTQSQLLRLLRYPRRYICFDSTPEGQVRADSLCEALMAFPGKTRKVILDAKDAGEASAKELRDLRKLLK